MTSNTKTRPELTIRPATPDDVAALTALSYKTIRAKYPPIIGSETVEGYIASGAVPKYYDERNAWLSVAEIDGEPVGAVALMDHEIHLMMVTLDHHRQGIGEALLRHGEAALFATHERIELQTFRDNLQAVNFYTKHGWTPVREYPMAETGIAMLTMQKQRH
ncbi:GNAT family N-acetyltransferase [Maricaulis sp.]|uniref:GNAT family N-acetyltransferase n=1 Tax=Maricaulis sp. TaxID=1486257 RepID=UPI002602F37F|nr:GNAT family N-acetyltransferase [Maricaulis sp.]